MEENVRDKVDRPWLRRHATVEIGGKERSVWLEKPIPEGADIHEIAGFMADVSLAFWGQELRAKHSAEATVLREELRQRQQNLM